MSTQTAENNQIASTQPLEQTDGQTENKQVHHKDEDLSKANKIGNYLIAETIGEGAFGKVKKATHILTGEKVAIKILNKQRMQQLSGDVNKIQKEINILKKIRHKNLIQLYEIMESKTNLFLIMEYCPKGELFDYIVKRKKLTEYTACKFFQHLIDGVEYMHSVKIVHRDLKPENLLLDDKINLKISDFGLSTIYHGKVSTPCGTPSYAPPEMLKGEIYNGEKSDVWSCGIILFAMLCGFLPFAESKEEIICEKILNHDYKIPESLSPRARDLLGKMMEVSPEKRIDLKSIKEHPWFKVTEPFLRQGIIIGIHQIPVDEIILNKVFEFGLNNKYEKLGTKEEIRKKIQENKFESSTACYYLILRKHITLGGSSISDLQSKAYVSFISNPNNLIDVSSMIYADHEIKGDSKLTFSPKRAKDNDQTNDLIATASTKVTLAKEKQASAELIQKKVSHSGTETEKHKSKADKSKTEEKKRKPNDESEYSSLVQKNENCPASSSQSLVNTSIQLRPNDTKPTSTKNMNQRNSNKGIHTEKCKEDQTSKTTEVIKKESNSAAVKTATTKTHNTKSSNISSNMANDFSKNGKTGATIQNSKGKIFIYIFFSE